MKTKIIVENMFQSLKENKKTVCPVCKREYKPLSNRDCFICLEVEAKLRFN